MNGKETVGFGVYQIKMAKILFLVLVAVVGCGGPSFTVGGTDEADGGPPVATGGAPMVGSGGKVGLSTGGSSGTGGAPSSGGASSSGGVVGSTGGAVDTDGGAGTVGSGGVSDVADACVLVTHHNGMGQTWQDCVPLGTHSEAQAVKACNAWYAANGGTGNGCSTASLKEAEILAGSNGIAWAWTGSTAGEVCQGPIFGGPGSCALVGPWG